MSPTIRAARMSMHPDDFFLAVVFGCGQKKSPKKVCNGRHLVTSFEYLALEIFSRFFCPPCRATHKAQDTLGSG